ncbi:MAG: hypothetical protein AAF646_13955 [Pseudomonadota bacterium]
MHDPKLWQRREAAVVRVMEREIAFRQPRQGAAVFNEAELEYVIEPD